MAEAVALCAKRVFFGSVKTYYVTGMRRSGNHAVIEWIKNGYDDALTPIEYGTVGPAFLGVSRSGKVVHLNDVNHLRISRIARSLFDCRASLKGTVEVVIISTEDCSDKKKRWWSSVADCEVYVTRDLLNVVASRLERLKERALEGRAAKACALYKNFFEDWYRIRWVENDDRRCSLRYERWITEREYNESAAENIGLPRSVMPQYHSRWGDGSSFVGAAKEENPGGYNARYKTIEWKENVVQWLIDLDEVYSCLTAPEREFLRCKRNGNDKT